MWYVTVPEEDEAKLAAKFAVMRELLDERQWRVYLGTEARALGALARGRARRAGAGRKKAEDSQPGLKQALGGLLEEATRGDPVSEITWCSLSLRDLERRLAARGWRCKKDAIARIMHQDGYSLQAMAKVLEGRQHPDRDGQFRHINAMIAAFRAAGHPVAVAAPGRRSSPARFTGTAAPGGRRGTR
jgi:hypothetical protein